MVAGRANRDYLTLTFSLHTRDLPITDVGEKSAGGGARRMGSIHCGPGETRTGCSSRGLRTALFVAAERDRSSNGQRAGGLAGSRSSGRN
jgi:hypothetical protein